MTEEWLNRAEWKENVILVDADYVDKVVFNLIVNFERMIGRRIPQADMAKWLECVALDGGIREGNHQTQVVLLHQKEQMDNFLLVLLPTWTARLSMVLWENFLSAVFLSRRW